MRPAQRLGFMPQFLISVVNDDFVAESEEEHDNADAAIEQAIKGALALGVDGIMASKSYFGAQVTVGDWNSRQRFVVSVGASPLKC